MISVAVSRSRLVNRMIQRGTPRKATFWTPVRAVENAWSSWRGSKFGSGGVGEHRVEVGVVTL
jgi:hypothetical protein